MSGPKLDIDQLLRQGSQHWMKQGPEEFPLSCPDCHESFGNMVLLDGFNLSQEEFKHAVESEGMDVRERIPPIVITCPHCGHEHDVNRLGVWMYILMCLWVVLLEKKAISVEGGFQAFLRGDEVVLQAGGR